MIYTVFPNDATLMPQDFDNWGDAYEYGEELGCDYVIEATEGNVY